MSFSLVSTDTIRAPRNLTRATAQRKLVKGPFGAWTYDDPEPPSVGGEAVKTHYTWRCSSCRALAVTTSETPPSKCGKCGR